jgi:hypothetical protein
LKYSKSGDAGVVGEVDDLHAPLTNAIAAQKATPLTHARPFRISANPNINYLTFAFAIAFRRSAQYFFIRFDTSFRAAAENFLVFRLAFRTD